MSKNNITVSHLCNVYLYLSLLKVIINLKEQDLKLENGTKSS